MTVAIFFLAEVGRFALLLVFAAAVITKLRGMRDFQHSVTQLAGIRDRRMAKAASYAVVAAEAAVVMMLAGGGAFAAPGFGLAILLLSVFTIAISRILGSGRSASCNCFGAEDQPISRTDVVRNAALTAIAVFGVAAPLSGAALSALTYAAAIAAAVNIAILIIGLKDFAFLVNRTRAGES